MTDYKYQYDRVSQLSNDNTLNVDTYRKLFRIIRNELSPMGSLYNLDFRCEIDNKSNYGSNSILIILRPGEDACDFRNFQLKFMISQVEQMCECTLLGCSSWNSEIYFEFSPTQSRVNRIILLDEEQKRTESDDFIRILENKLLVLEKYKTYCEERIESFKIGKDV